ncbi:unnamed protein product [Symbiodinium sp. CCMP2592]|nr:unnamed protein product [Symbiodinium sp. CCMP2592]
MLCMDLFKLLPVKDNAERPPAEEPSRASTDDAWDGLLQDRPDADASNARRATKLICLICKRCSRDKGVRWGQYNTLKAPIGDGCARCFRICFQILCLEWSQACVLLAEKEAVTTKKWKEAEANVIAQEEWEAEYGNDPELPHPIKTRSGVVNSSSLSESFSWEVAFMTDADLLRWAGATAKTLGLQQDDRVSEDGTSVLRGAYVALRDLPSTMKLGDIWSLKKVKFSLDRNLTVSENLLECQLHATQAQNVKKAATAKVLSRRNPALTLSKLEALPTLVSLQAKAQAVEDERKQAEAAGRFGVEPDQQVDHKRSVGLALGSLDDEPALPAKKQRKADGKAKAAPKRKPGERDGRDREPSPAPSIISASATQRRPPSNFEAKTGSAAVGEPTSEAEILKRLPGDPELQRVAMRMGKIPESFLSLVPQRFMKGERLGRSLRAAKASFASVGFEKSQPLLYPCAASPAASVGSPFPVCCVVKN